MSGVAENYFNKFNILPLASEFLLSLLSFIVDNMENFQANCDIKVKLSRYMLCRHLGGEEK